MDIALEHRDAALVALGRHLKARGYRFTTVTPATHARVNARPDNKIASTLEDIFGWSRPFSPDVLPEDMAGALRDGGAMAPHGNLCRSTVRFSTLERQIFMHSAFPTDTADAVFFGPDTYRFANALRTTFREAGDGQAMTIVDIGCGTGAGGLYLQSLLSGPVHQILGDINPAAIRFARINAVLNGCEARAVRSDIMSDISESADIIIVDQQMVKASHSLEAATKEAVLMEIDRVVNFFQTRYNKKVNQCLLVGGRATEKETRDFLTSKLRLPMKVGDPFARIQYPSSLERILKEELGPPLAVAVGLAMRED